MRKWTVALLLLLMALPCLFADTGMIQWRYKIRKTVEESIELSFTDPTGSSISTYEINLNKGIAQSQVQLVVVTNKVNPYTLRLTFTPMSSQRSGATFIGFYKARIFDIITYSTGDSSTREVEFTSADNVSVTFPGDNSDDASNTVSFRYPISFDFSEYINDYAAGSHSATITVEVAAQ